MSYSEENTLQKETSKIEIPEFLEGRSLKKIALPSFLTSDTSKKKVKYGTHSVLAYENNDTNTDTYACGTTCEVSLQQCRECSTCQGCEDNCQHGPCESACMITCEVNSQCGCESAMCGACERPQCYQCGSCESGECGSCETCEYCESCEGCETYCEYECQGAQHTHNWEYTDWQYVDENRCKRLKYCSGSGTCTSKPEEEYKSHDYWATRYEWVNNETCKSIFKCSYCGNEKDGSTTSHVWEIESWDQGDETHCKKNLICSACKGTLTQLVKHEFVDGKCKWCGREENGFPPKFEWSRPKVKGESFYFGVDEYERYVNYLNQKLVYFKKSKVSKTKVTKGEKVTALTINDLLAGLRRLNAKSVPGDVSKGGIITASFLNNLRDSLNSVVKPVAQEETINE